MLKISVIMPAYNAEKYIAEAVDSVLGQTLADFEFIIINDCSADRTEEMILSYDDPRIVYLKNERNLGVAATLNRGLAIARGEYIARMDADDISMPERFAKQVSHMDQNPNIVVLGSSLECFCENEMIRTVRPASDPKQMKVDMLFSCGVAHPSVMMRAAVIRDLGGYDTDFNGLEDYELWCRVMEKHEITALPDILLRYRIHGSQVTQNPSLHYRERMRRLKVQQLRNLGLEPDAAEAFFLFCEEGALNTAEKLKALETFFAAADDANEKKQIYDRDKLRTAFRAVILSCVMRLPELERKKAMSECCFLRKQDLLVYTIKQKIKKMLGRN